MAQSIRRGCCFVKYLYYLIHYNVSKNKFSLEQPLCKDCREPRQAHASSTQDGVKRPKKTTLLPCLRKRYCCSELDGKDDEDYPENDGIGTDQPGQTQEYNIRSYDQKCTQ
jgi:hypothetical protein